MNATMNATQLMAHLEAVQAGTAEMQDSPALHAVSPNLAILVERAKEAQEKMLHGIEDAMAEAEYFVWNDEEDGPFPYDMEQGSLYGIGGVVLTPNRHASRRMRAEMMDYSLDGRGGSRVLVFPVNDNGKFYVLQFRKGRMMYNIDIRALWEASR